MQLLLVAFSVCLQVCVSAAHSQEPEKLTLQTIIGAKLLRASESETSISEKQKLNEYRCRMTRKYRSLTESPVDRAIHYSCSGAVVGVAFYVGNDLGRHKPEKISDYIKKKFANAGVFAEVFIGESVNGNSSISYIIRGGRDVMNPKEPYSAINTIEGFAANMKLVFFADKILSPEELKVWSKYSTAYKPKTKGDDV